jgi:hypothetical protein
MGAIESMLACESEGSPMVFLFLPYILQILLILHAVRNGKNFTWIWLLIMVPIVGGVVYLIVEVLPDLRRGRLVDGEQVALWINRNARLKRLEEDVKLSDTVANNIHLAEEHARLGNHGEAAKIYQSQLKGMYANDASLLLKLARAAFFARDYALAASSFDKVETQSALSSTEVKTYWFYARFMTEKTDERLEELKRLFEVTKASEVGRYLCLAYEQTGDAAEMKRAIELVQLQIKRLHGGVRASAARHLRAMRESLGRVSEGVKK